MAKNLIGLLKFKYNLRKKTIVYVKNEGFNLNTMTITSKTIVSCDILGLEESHQCICFEYAFSKMCQYVTTNEKVCKNLTYISIKIA